MTILSATLLLFLVTDPVGNIPVFLGVLKNIDSNRHKRIIVRELCIGFAILLIFLFSGRYILAFLNVSQSSLSVAGGIILFMIAIKMVFAGSEKIFEGSSYGEPLIVPLAVPLIAGPSAMATVMLLAAKAPSRLFDWLIALLFAWLISGIILFFSDNLERILGKRAITALERLMGLLLTAIAVQMFINGIRESMFL
jgi:multiple antibiotic resistance protein